MHKRMKTSNPNAICVFSSSAPDTSTLDLYQYFDNQLVSDFAFASPMMLY